VGEQDCDRRALTAAPVYDQSASKNENLGECVLDTAKNRSTGPKPFADYSSLVGQRLLIHTTLDG